VRTDAEALDAVAERIGATELVLTTFVDPDRIVPTAADVARFEGLRVECRVLGTELLDHILMSGHRWRSVREVSGLSEPGEDPGASTTW
jgi:DNA repair protein RadC